MGRRPAEALRTAALSPPLQWPLFHSCCLLRAGARFHWHLLRRAPPAQARSRHVLCICSQLSNRFRDLQLLSKDAWHVQPLLHEPWAGFCQISPPSCPPTSRTYQQVRLSVIVLMPHNSPRKGELSLFPNGNLRHPQFPDGETEAGRGKVMARLHNGWDWTQGAGSVPPRSPSPGARVRGHSPHCRAYRAPTGLMSRPTSLTLFPGPTDISRVKVKAKWVRRTTTLSTNAHHYELGTQAFTYRSPAGKALLLSPFSR